MFSRKLPFHATPPAWPPARRARDRSTRPALVGLIVTLWLALVLPVLSQAATPAGPALTARWQTSPAIAGKANAVIVVPADGASQVDLSGVSASIVSVDGDEPLTLTVAADGAWSGAYTPAKAGAYALHMAGTVADDAIDLRLPLEDVRAVAVNLPAIQSGAPDGRQSEAPTGPDWVTIGGFGLAAVLLIAAVWLGRRGH